MRLHKCIVSIVLTVFLIFTISGNAAYNPKNEKIRVGYVQSEEYYQFGEALCGIAFGLQEVGVIDGLEISREEADASVVWESLVKCDSDFFVFEPNYFYTIKDMNTIDYPQFVNRNDIDLIFVNGTTAGVYFTENEITNDYMVFSSIDPVTAGITKSVDERVKPNSYTYCDPSHMARQIEVAYNIFNFSKIGVVYEDNKSAYSYSGIGQLYDKAQEHGFSIAELHVDESRGTYDDARYYAELKDAYKELIAQGIDALYITVATTAPEKLPWLLEDIQNAGILTLSQPGGEQLKYGVVLGVTQSDFPDEGRHIARLIKQYVDGVPIGELPQLYEIVPRITLNYDALVASKLELPFKVLLSFDEIIRSEAAVKYG